MNYQGFRNYPGPATPGAQTPFGGFSRPVSPTLHASTSAPRPSSWLSESSNEWVDGNENFTKHGNAHKKSSSLGAFAASHDSVASLPAMSRQAQDLKRSRSPPSVTGDDVSVKNSRSFKGRPVLSPPGWSNQSKLFGDFSSSSTQQELLSAPYPGNSDTWNNLPTKDTKYQTPKRTRSPHLPTNVVSQENSLLDQSNFKSHLQAPEAMATKTMNFQVPGKTRLPSLPSSDGILDDNCPIQDDSERELQAKAKRLVRFKDELSQPVQSSHSVGNENVVGKRLNLSSSDGRKLTVEASKASVGLYSGGNVFSDNEVQEPSTVIIGICLDMCPESERAERERKGDLDQHERLNGNRNQTTKFLAVKKYNRTAEREAGLIRPMPILKNTMDYLLNLLDGPYDDSFLGLYNFLWDRMRAIRMDLRMQHIFNLDAIALLEQMIRFHIIAMHELCEYTKGEGFSEGFDAHLNIEQMNKTSVELFQLYDDHRKKGIVLPTEREFRGYYALLKLDKHPGYNVEPAELSLDLAKMTREIRHTSEVLFARNVARACRTGNFIAFFRMARKANYLQSCLMHAHFAKLRTQALASIHCGLQNNQGIPVSLVAKWLGMEEEDIEDLLVYHGFLTKEFEEPYMVKDGPFLNVENDYPVKCSKLVCLKKSERIMDDVLSCHNGQLFYKESKEIQFEKPSGMELTTIQFSQAESSSQVINEKTPDYKTLVSPKAIEQLKPMPKLSIVSEQNSDDHQFGTLQWQTLSQISSKSQQGKFKSVDKQNSTGKIPLERQLHATVNAAPVEIMPRRIEGEFLPVLQPDYTYNAASHSVIIEEPKDVNSMDFQENITTDAVLTSDYDKEVAEAKLKYILRMWRRRSSKKRELRKQRQLEASAALSSLSLGLPIWKYNDQPKIFGELNIDHMMSTRYEKHERSRAKLNVSELVAAKLSERNPDSRCICWKIVVCSQDNPNGDIPGWTSGYLASRTWLFSKLMPTEDNDDNLVLSSASLSIWKKWIPSNFCGHSTCCFSVIKDSKSNNLNGTLEGASGVLFLVSKYIPWMLQKNQLHELLSSLPSRSNIPLLILSAEDYNDPSAIVSELGLDNIDKSRIGIFCVVSLVKNQRMELLDQFFSAEQLQEGLQWLASVCPLQPTLQCVKVRELVMSHLTSSMEFRDDLDACQVGPDYCISAFNNALDQSIWEVMEAVKTNPCKWPCPEIALLELSGEAKNIVSSHVPSLGWSSALRIEPLLSMLRQCKLPYFSDDISWMYKGSEVGDDIKKQTTQFESCLVRYLTQSTQLLGPLMAMKEASVMLQKCTFFQLRDSAYYIVPNWAMIFRRIFNWRLMSVSQGDLSSAYVLKQHVATNLSSTHPVKLEIGDSGNSPSFLVRPSLDEMVEVSCSPLALKIQHSEDEAFQPEQTFITDNSAVELATNDHLVRDAHHFERDVDVAIVSCSSLTKVSDNSNSGLVVSNRATNAPDRLAELLKRCNMVQNMIDEKLSFYF